MTPVSQTSSSRIADIVAGTFHTHGIRHAYGIPGGEVLTLIDALGRSGIRFVLCRHETPAASMAAGTSTVNGAPGLLVTTVGPGLANAVNAIADAVQERVPLIVLSGAVDHDIRHRYTHQVLDQAALLRGLVKGSFEIEGAGAGATVARAIELAMTVPFGPVHLDLAPGTARLYAKAGDRVVRPADTCRLTAHPGDTAVAKFAELLASSQRPLVIAGVEAAREDAGSAVLELCQRLQAPLITTYKAKGLVDETQRECLGGAGLSPLADQPLLDLVRAADTVLLAGYDPIEMRQGWLEPADSQQTVIEVCGHPYDHAMHRCDHRLVGPIAGSLGALAASIAPCQGQWSQGEPEFTRQRLQDAFAGPPHWGPHAVIETLLDVLDEDAIVTVDSGAHRILLSQKFKVRRPLGLLQSAGFCTMGVAVPLAAGAKAAAPERTTVAVVGDGGLEMGIGELATLRDEGLHIVVVVIQDESLALIELKQKNMQYDRRGVELGKTHFEEIAAAFGGHGVRVTERDAFADELVHAMRRDTFSVIVCQVEASDYVDGI